MRVPPELQCCCCCYSTAEKKNPAAAGFLVSACPMKSCLRSNVGRLQALGTFFYIIGDRLTFGQGLETRALYRVEMHEYVIAAIVLRDETKTFGLVKPLYCTCSHITFYLE